MTKQRTPKPSAETAPMTVAQKRRQTMNRVVCGFLAFALLATMAGGVLGAM